MCAGTKFRRLVPDEGPVSQNPAQVKRVIFCTGKVYYELAKERKRQKLEKDVAIIRLEQVFNLLFLNFPCTVDLNVRALLFYNVFLFFLCLPSDLSIPI